MSIFNYEINEPIQFNEVDAYKDGLQDFARAYLFRLYLTFPTGINEFQGGVMARSLYAKSTTLPDVSVEEVSSYFMGQQFKMASVRRCSDWMVTLYIDKKTSLYIDLYNWNRKCHSSENIYSMPKDYMVGYSKNPGRQVIQLLGSKSIDFNILNIVKASLSYGIVNTPVMTYYLDYAWPKTIANVALDYESNQFITMDVTFSFQAYEVKKNVL
jgi:hypothetical protein